MRGRADGARRAITSLGKLGAEPGRHGVLTVPGSVAPPDGSFDDYLRLPFGHPPAVLEEGLRRLARAWQAYTPTGQPRGQSVSVIV